MIAGNGFAGIHMTSGDGNTIQGNYIGVAADGTTPLGNSAAGVLVDPGNNNLIGGTAPGAGNVIAHNGGGGLFFGSGGVHVRGGTGNSVLGNSIFSNAGFLHQLGIGLGDDTVTANDAADADTGPNDLQNFPVVASVLANSGGAVMSGTLASKPSTTYRLEFFTNGAGDSSG